MAGGQLCLLIPNQYFAEKVCQQARRKPVPRCLFGPPDPVQTERLLQEQMQRERERFERRWNVDLDQLDAAIERRVKQEESRIPEVREVREVREVETVVIGKGSVRPVVKRSKRPSRFQKRVRVAGTIKRQTYLTDFWRARRSLCRVYGKSKSRVPVAVQAPIPEALLEDPAPLQD